MNRFRSVSASQLNDPDKFDRDALIFANSVFASDSSSDNDEEILLKIHPDNPQPPPPPSSASLQQQFFSQLVAEFHEPSHTPSSQFTALSPTSLPSMALSPSLHSVPRPLSPFSSQDESEASSDYKKMKRKVYHAEINQRITQLQDRLQLKRSTSLPNLISSAKNKIQQIHQDFQHIQQAHRQFFCASAIPQCVSDTEGVICSGNAMFNELFEGSDNQFAAGGFTLYHIVAADNKSQVQMLLRTIKSMIEAKAPYPVAQIEEVGLHGFHTRSIGTARLVCWCSLPSGSFFKEVRLICSFMNLRQD